jgi:hypothetical protein
MIKDVFFKTRGRFSVEPSSRLKKHRYSLKGKLQSVEQYTIVAFIRGEHSNCLPEVGCLPEGREDNPARVNHLDVHLVLDGNNCFIIPKLHIRMILACLNKNV